MIRERSVLFLGLSNFQRYRMISGPGMGPYIAVFVLGLSELYIYVWIDYDPGMGPYRPQMTVTLCTIPGQ